MVIVDYKGVLHKQSGPVTVTVEMNGVGEGKCPYGEEYTMQIPELNNGYYIEIPWSKIEEGFNSGVKYYEMVVYL